MQQRSDPRGKVYTRILEDVASLPPRSDHRLQRIYVQRLKDYGIPITSLLDNPVATFDEFAFQKISVATQDAENKKWMIQSSSLLRQQIDVFFSEILLKTKFNELRRIERAFIKRNQKKEYPVVEDEEISAIFGSIAEELETEAKAPIIFLPPREETENDDVRPKSRGKFAPDTPKSAEPPRTPSDVVRLNEEYLRYRFHNAIVPRGDTETLVLFLKTPAVNNRNVWVTDNQDTPLHSAARSQNTKWAKELIDIIMNPEDDSWSNCPFSPWELINYQNKQRNTALHLAVENQSTQVAQCLIENGANIVMRNSQGVTPLERMYEKTPEAVIQVLNMALIPGAGFPDDGNLSLSLDFRAVVGWSCQAVSAEQVPQTQPDNGTSFEMKPNLTKSASEDNPLIKPHVVAVSHDEEVCPAPILEMDLLAKMVYQNFDSSASIILPHVVVKTFLDLKWKKLRVPIYLLTLFYIIVYLLFTAFVIRIFVSRFPYVTEIGNSTSESNVETPSFPENLTVWDYVWGIWLHPAAGIELGDPLPGTNALVDPGVAAALMILASIYIFIELYELVLIQQVVAVSTPEALCYYFAGIENVLQLLFTAGAILVTSVGFWSESRLDNWTYWVAAWSVVLAWILILLQLGNIYGVGKYVQMFKTVIKRFAIVMATYVCFLVGFSIAFSILFPKDRFATFPMSFFRSISMMAGELNFDEIFDPEKIRPFPFATQAVYFGFTATVTIVLINLLTGLTVDDVGKIFKESDVIHRSIQVERLYILERMLHKWRRDLYVLPQTKRFLGSPCTVDTKISDLPLELHRELRLLYADPEEYERQYLQQE